MKKIILICSSMVLVASTAVFAETPKIIAVSEPKELKTYQVELDIDTIIEKRASDFAPCFPPISTEVDIYREVLKDPKVVQILKFEYVDSQKSLEACPDRAILRARVRYLSQ